AATPSFSPNHCSTRAASGREAGSEERSCIQNWLHPAGAAGETDAGGAGSREVFAASTSITEPVNGGLPVKASYSITPTAYQSVASFRGARFEICSGAM